MAHGSAGAAANPTVYVEPELGPGPRLAHFPVTFFATVMGIAGLSLAWTRAAQVLGVPAGIGEIIFWLALAVYGTVLITYLVKVLRFRSAVRDELAHPVRLSFVPTATIGLLLVATAGQDIVTGLAEVLWWIGAAGQFILTLYVLHAWINRPTFGLGHVTPAWFIPVVGMVVVPLAGVRYGPDELSWFFFSVGLAFWIPLLAIVLSRLFVHDQPVPPRLLPTLAVLIAPPAVAMLAYLRLVPDGFEGLPRALYYTALFFGLLFATQLNRLRRLPFFLSWWAYSFPLAALATATIVMDGHLEGWFFTVASWFLLVIATALVLLLTVRTALGMIRGQICVPE